MFVLKASGRIGRVGFLAGLVGWSSCSFSPEISEPSGYVICSDTTGCPVGFTCLQGLCAPDCLDLTRIARTEPGALDRGLSRICTVQENTRQCEDIVPDGEKVSVDLESNQFLLFAQDPSEEASACERAVVHISMLAAMLDQVTQLDMVLWGGNHVVGMNELQLKKEYEPANDEEWLEAFRNQTFFFVVDMSKISWPLEVRFFPARIDAEEDGSSFFFREFELSCCVR